MKAATASNRRQRERGGRTAWRDLRAVERAPRARTPAAMQEVNLDHRNAARAVARTAAARVPVNATRPRGISRGLG